MRGAIALLAAVLCITSTIGCKTGEPVAQQQVQEQNTEQEILRKQEEQNTRMTELQAALNDLRQTAMRREAESPFLDDLTAAERLLGSAASCVTDRDAEGAKAVLARVEDLLISARSLAPAAQIIEHLERAVLFINDQKGAEAIGEVLAARAETYSPGARALVPKLPQEFDQIPDQLKRGDGAAAREAITALIASLGKDDTLRQLRAAYQSIASARNAMDRLAWSVVSAEVDEMKAIIGHIKETASPTLQPEEGKPQPPEKAAQGEAAEEKPAEEERQPAEEAAPGATEAEGRAGSAAEQPAAPQGTSTQEEPTASEEKAPQPAPSTDAGAATPPTR